MEPESAPVYQVRRATVDDLPQLKLLWAAERHPDGEFDKRFTEFQVAVDHDGSIVGAVGLRIYKLQGLIHSEAFASRDDAAAIRPVLWQRIVNVARNHGLVRLWMMPTTSFYRDQGMAEADETLRAKLPEDFGHPKADWITLRLKEENASAVSLEKEFEIFAQSQKDSTEDLLRRAQVFKVLAYVLLVVAFGALAALVVVAMRARRKR